MSPHRWLVFNDGVAGAACRGVSPRGPLPPPPTDRRCQPDARAPARGRNSARVPFRLLTGPPDLACATATRGRRRAATPHRLPSGVPRSPPPTGGAPRRFPVCTRRDAHALSRQGGGVVAPRGPAGRPSPVSAPPRPRRDACRAAASGVRAVDPPAAGHSPVPFPILTRGHRAPLPSLASTPCVVAGLVGGRQSGRDGRRLPPPCAPRPLVADAGATP